MDHKAVLLKQASNKQELTNWENILITKNKDCIINFEILPADYLTREFILNPAEVQTKLSWSWVDNEEKCLESAPHRFK